LEGLFAQFELQAARRIKQFAVALPDEETPRIDDLCGNGVDSNFDQLLFAMGSVVRSRPKPLVDKLMTWRHGFSPNTSSTAMGSPTSLLLSSPFESGNSSRASVLPARGVPNPNSRHYLTTTNPIVAERRSAAVTYLLCRVLIEVFGQSDLPSITQDLANKLEDIAYTDQLKGVTKEILEKSPTKLAKWDLVSRLLGTMAEKDFEGVSSRFLSDLRAYQRVLGVKGQSDKKVDEEKATTLLRGMRYLRLQTDTDNAWSRSSTFFNALAELFVAVHGQPAKLAYTQVICTLLLGAAATPGIGALRTSSMNLESSAWRKAVRALIDRFALLSVKPKYWLTAFPVQALLICCAPYDIFLAKWLLFVSSLPPRLREKTHRATVFKAISRLTWAYTRRAAEKDFALRHLEDIARSMFFAGKKYPLSADPAIALPAVELVRIIGSKNLDLCFRIIIFPLLNADILLSSKDYKVDHLDPDRMVIGIRGFLAVMSDLEHNEPLLFPLFGEIDDIPSAASTRKQYDANTKGREARHAQTLKPIVSTSLPETIRNHYTRFCEVLGKITLICDQAFGGQAVLDEKSSPVIPKTPGIENWTFVRKDDGLTDERQAFFELLHAAILALPRCSSPQIPVHNMVTLLLNGIAHLEKNIAASSATSLKSVARQGYAQYVVTRLSNHLQQLDTRLFAASTNGSAHFETTLVLYAELVYIWIEEISDKKKKALADRPDASKPAARALGLDNPSIWNQIDKVESQSLLFLCSPSSRVRSCAIKLLKLVAKFDEVHDQDNVRVASILQEDYLKILGPDVQGLSVGDRSRLQQDHRVGGKSHVLIDLCCSPDGEVDTSLWFKLFPKILQRIFEACPMAATQTREDISARLSHMHPMIDTVIDRSRNQLVFDAVQSRPKRATSSASTIEQWKLYLVFVCTTLTRAGVNSQPGPQDPNHVRKSSKSSQSMQEPFTTAIDLFTRVIPMLASENNHVRSAAVIGLGSIKLNLYRPLLESMDAVVQARIEDSKKPHNAHQRGTSSPRRNTPSDHFRTDVAHVYKLTSHFLQKPEVLKDEWILTHMADYTTEMFHFLQRWEGNQEYQQLRIHYCALVESFFTALNTRSDPQRWMPFQTRRAAFTSLEEWCGHATPRHQREAAASRNANVRVSESERHDVKNAAHSAMATLCAGPISVAINGKPQTFDVKRMLSWVDGLFHNPSDEAQAIGQRALKNMILFNLQYPYLLYESMAKLYFVSFPKGLESYLQVVSDLLMGQPTVLVPYWRVLSVLLCTLGHEESGIRMKSARLLRFFDESQPKQAKLQDLDISISDRTAAVYKKAQYEISQRLAARDDDELAFNVFSESSKRFKFLQPDQQRNMVLAILPWIKTINLQLDPNGGPTANSYMLLVNLFEITMISTTSLHNEIQALWQALSTGPHAGNVRLVLDFIIDLSVYGREHQYVEVARQIVVFLSSTPAGQKVIEFLLLQIGPDAMVSGKRQPMVIPENLTGFPYLAELSATVRQRGTKQIAMSLGQVSLILLVDLIVSPVSIATDKVPSLLQIVLVLWDHHLDVVQDSAREMLVHLIHELVISKMDDAALLTEKPAVEEFIELIRRLDPKVVWAYSEGSGMDSTFDVPESMRYVITETVRVFSITHPGIRSAWGQTMLDWGIQCPARPLTCRSLQMYRVVLQPLNQRIVSDLLARLHIAISDSEMDIQLYCLEIIRDLRGIVEHIGTDDLALVPTLFWTMCTCLESVNEGEFLEALAMLDAFLEKFDLGNPENHSLLVLRKPVKWKWSPDGLTGLIYKGCKSGACLEKCLGTLDRLLSIPSNTLVGDDTRLMYSLLAFLPSLLHASEEMPVRSSYTKACETLGAMAASRDYLVLARFLEGYAAAQFQTKPECLAALVEAIRSDLSPKWDLPILKTLMGFLVNKLPWFKSMTLELLQAVIPGIDMQRAEIAAYGPELVSPLLGLVQTEHAPQALRILHSVMGMTGKPMDRELLQTSLLGPSTDRKVRKDHENTQSLYGIPEDSGWAMPTPARSKDVTRAHVHDVFLTFSDGAVLDANGLPTPTQEVEFYQDDTHSRKGSYFPDRTETMTSEEVTLTETNMGELVSKLDNLDDFFENATPEVSPSYNLNSFFARTSNGSVSMNGYDTQFTSSTNHNRGMNRNTSFSSSKSGYNTDYPPVPMKLRGPAVMSPSAFSLSPKRVPRPMMHGRSVTSPVNNTQKTPPERLFGVSSDEREPFSDDDISLGRVSTSDASFATEMGARSALARTKQPSRLAGMKSSLRRLTGQDRQRAVMRTPLDPSPEVPMPRVPAHYMMQNPHSADL